MTDTSIWSFVNYDCHTGKEVETPSTVNNSLIQDYTCPDDYANLWNDSRDQTIYNKHLSSYLLWMRYVFCFPDFPIKTQREKKTLFTKITKQIFRSTLQMINGGLKFLQSLRQAEKSNLLISFFI